MTHLKTALWFIASLAGLILLFSLYPAVHPLPGIGFKISHTEAEAFAARLLHFSNPENIKKKQTNFIILKTASAEKDSFSGYWEVNLLPENARPRNISISSGQGNVRTRVESDWDVVEIGADGRLLKAEFQSSWLAFSADSTAQPDTSGSRQRARQTALRFLQLARWDSAAVGIETISAEKEKGDSVYTLTLKLNDRETPHQLRVSSGRVIGFEKTGENLESEAEESNNSQYLEIFFVIILIFLIIGAAVLLVRFGQQANLSFRIGIAPAVIVAFFYALQFSLQLWTSSAWLSLISVVVVALGTALGMFLLYPVTDALVRQQWPEKLKSTDSFYQGRFFTPAAGKAILLGTALAIFSLLYYSGVLFFARSIGSLSAGENGHLSYSLSIIFPLLALTAEMLASSFFHEIFFRVFSISLLKKLVRSTRILLPLAALAGFSFTVSVEPENFWIHLAALAGPALLFALFFIRYDALTVIAGYFIFLLLQKAVVFTVTAESYFNNLGLGFLLIFAALVLLAFLAVVRQGNRESENLPAFVPDYIRQREERDRLVRELEIARRIQAQFLPKTTPQLPGYQIAAFCEPAWEVGGDYFDFFEMKDGRLGITIGDVSNKGVSASFFMTLVKGFLQSLAQHYDDPVEILCEANRLFYRNVERGHFISMIFGIIEPASGRFVYARAGHTPLLILASSPQSSEWQTPPGAGIGLMETEPFRRLLAQQEIILRKDDIIVLFTDGYPEAMNSQKEEFDTARMVEIIDNSRRQPPHKIVDALEAAIQRWQGNETATDDRTIVVLKRLG
ncbi:MAG: PP2C family protein-serine/threonine phosphatase [Calditrichia bacterium]